MTEQRRILVTGASRGIGRACALSLAAHGYEVCARLKADPRTCDIPVIFISALAQLEDKVKAFELGGVDYITKPFRVEEVLARVGTHLALYTLQRQLAQEKTRVETARTILWTVLNNLDALIYVADMETHRVLFANAQLQGQCHNISF